MPGINRGPSFIRKAINYARDTASHVANGLRRAGQGILLRRLMVCRAPCYFYDPKSDRCRHMQCGCPITKKAARESSECPMGYWPKLEEK